MPLPSVSRAMRGFDAILVGGGPAGLTAAIYLARFHLSVCVVDGGDSRAALIPLTRNYPGFPEGIAGPDLLARMQRQAELYGARIERATIERIEGSAGSFTLSGRGMELEARALILATGVRNRRPPLEEATHAEAVAHGLLRYCPICDAFEVTDKAVAVLGSGASALGEARFLRSYSKTVSLLLPPGEEIGAAEHADMSGLGIKILRCDRWHIDSEARCIRASANGALHRFDSLYVALGTDPRSDLAGSLGVARSEEGCIRVDSHQRTSVAGVYAAGDVVLGLDQISHAMGEGAVAATSLRNDLCEERPLLR